MATQNETWVRNSAFELVRKHGFIEAQNMCAKWRDQSSFGTASYAMHNKICKQLAEFATIGAMFRTVGK